VIHHTSVAGCQAGPGNVLIDTEFAGLINASDPFKLLWTKRSFEAQKTRQ
jgi:hypothetical protein